MAKVMIGLPNQGSFRAEVVVSIIKMLQEPCGHEIQMDFTALSPTDNCRNHIVNAAIEQDSDYLLFIDSDNPPEKNPLELIDLDLDVTVLPTLIFLSNKFGNVGKIPLCWNVFTWEESKDMWRDYKDYDGLQEIDSGGTGCMIIARRVFEKCRPCFVRGWNPDGTADKGSDLLFCQKAKNLDFKIWAHFGYFCSHYKTVNLLDVYRMIDWRNIVHALKPNINTPDYWDAEWSQRQERIMPIYDPILNLIKENKNGNDPIKVLDFGCGRGDFLSMLHSDNDIDAIGMDYSPKAIEVCRQRGFKAELGDRPTPGWDVIVCTEVLEHVDDDDQLIRTMLECANTVIYSVPWDCLPPGLEPEHRRVYTKEYVKRITPQLKQIHEMDDYMVVEAGG
jgi:SAM-dependent methyltransferase